jgi:hypothetical protein
MERADDNHWVTEYLTYFPQELQSNHRTERPTEPKRKAYLFTLNGY